MRIAIIHYWLVTPGGGEKVLRTLCEMYPEADIYTHCLNPQAIPDGLKSHNIRTTFIGKLPFSTKLYKLYLPLMPLALDLLDLSDYDLVISCESGPTKGVITQVDCKHICYCHTPMRYLWESKDIYLKSSNIILRFFMQLFFHYLRFWDVLSSQRVDTFVANSNAVAQRIRRWWGKESTVVHPPVDTNFFRSFKQEEPQDYYLFAGRLVKYKRADLAIKACEKLHRKLVVVGEGPEMDTLKAMAGPDINFRGRVDRDELARLYSGCKALLFPGEEDFGIVPVEVMATGRPVIAYQKGGALDYVTEDTGLFFDNQNPDSLADAIRYFESIQSDFNADKISNHTEKFSKALFKQKMHDIINA
ncbi:glycosyltransferase [uncultured Pseudodesulfovibrio sp.]|uniref:glycosyltransferase n=1 Tax=uncultured Pseudodesulfovibrio sp. TaxID=2035858 RepID=UPI0029C8C517|nr:glycosyltransferase [uncultured Pseudodesulfovibrio sp.]